MLKTSKCINYNFTSCLKLSGWWVWYFWDVKNKGPGAIGKFLFILWKICHQFSEILVNPLIFLILPNFVEPYQSPKASSSCLRVGQIFFRCEIWQIFQFTSQATRSVFLHNRFFQLSKGSRVVQKMQHTFAKMIPKMIYTKKNQLL